MEKRLKELDHHALKDVSFSPNEKQQIMQKVKGDLQPKSRNTGRTFQLYASVITVLAIASMLVLSYTGLLTEKKIATDETSIIPNETNKNTHNLTTEQELLLDKMLNSIDYYDKMKGTYGFDNISVSFQVDLEQGKCYELRNYEERPAYTICDGMFLYQYNAPYGYNEEYKPLNRVKGVNRSYINENKELVTRNDYPPLLDVLFNPQQLIANTVGFNDDWEVTESSDTFLNRSVLVVEGELESTIKSPLGSEIDSFRYLVDEQTGILLKYELLLNGIKIEESYFSSIEIDGDLDESLFSRAMIPYKEEILVDEEDSSQVEEDRIYPITDEEKEIMFQDFHDHVEALNSRDLEKLMNTYSKQEIIYPIEDFQTQLKEAEDQERVDKIDSIELMFEYVTDEALIATTITTTTNEETITKQALIGLVLEEGQWKIYSTHLLTKSHSKNQSENFDNRRMLMERFDKWYPSGQIKNFFYQKDYLEL
ncbi:hypothetical protein [Sutcliffiella horikoshii]|uniref:hypothetical protein n=1 Tax=Sutcliffiella horikoshii TaxID=79883 RepID=UPI00384DF0AB